MHNQNCFEETSDRR